MDQGSTKGVIQMEKGYSIEVLEETKNENSYKQVIRISIEGGVGNSSRVRCVR